MINPLLLIVVAARMVSAMAVTFFLFLFYFILFHFIFCFYFHLLPTITAKEDSRGISGPWIWRQFKTLYLLLATIPPRLWSPTSLPTLPITSAAITSNSNTNTSNSNTITAPSRSNGNRLTVVVVVVVVVVVAVVFMILAMIVEVGEIIGILEVVFVVLTTPFTLLSFNVCQSISSYHSL